MGREIKHVPLDFDWPLKEIWSGYIGPDVRDCPDCKAGYSEAHELLAKHVNSLVWDHAALQESAEYRQITTFLCGREPRLYLLGHDSLDAYTAIRKMGDLAGLPEGWTTCKTCDGNAVHPDDQEKADRWERTEPPIGEGWQVWETVSEGSPVSPVFAAKPNLVEWLIEQGYSALAAEKFADREWAPSAMFVIDEDGKSSFYENIESSVL